MEKIQFNLTHNDSVAQITLSDGKGNVLDSVMMSEIQTVLDSLKSKTGIKLITFEGGGKHFSFGASVEEHKKEYASEMLESFHRLFFTMMNLSIPTLAKISGQCLGGGMELALYCNFIFTDKTAVLGVPEITLGVFPPPASILLPMKVGGARAEELILTGKRITGEEAKAIGLVNEVYEHREAMDRCVDEWIAKNILPLSASSLRRAVKASRIFQNHIFSKFLPALEELYISDLMQTYDANEGINSFLEKRKPIWRNS
jgi:cyclohexa-1,5-dienecarbonyl-CoA hydratase